MHTFVSFASHLLLFFHTSSSAVSSNFKTIFEFNIPEYSRLYKNIYHSCKFLYKSLRIHNMAICDKILTWQMPYFFNVNWTCINLGKFYGPCYLSDNSSKQTSKKKKCKKNPNHSFPYDKLSKYIRNSQHKT